jgi:hypothetical protein
MEQAARDFDAGRRRVAVAHFQVACRRAGGEGKDANALTTRHR